MEELKSNIEKILNQFAQEEMGNRLSQFALISLRGMILDAVDKAVNIKKESPKKEIEKAK